MSPRFYSLLPPTYSSRSRAEGSYWTAAAASASWFIAVTTAWMRATLWVASLVAGVMQPSGKSERLQGLLQREDLTEMPRERVADGVSRIRRPRPRHDGHLAGLAHACWLAVRRRARPRRCVDAVRARPGLFGDRPTSAGDRDHHSVGDPREIRDRPERRQDTRVLRGGNRGDRSAAHVRTGRDRAFEGRGRGRGAVRIADVDVVAARASDERERSHGSQGRGKRK